MKNRLVRGIGNGLVLLSFLGFLYIFFPVFHAYFFPTSMPSVYEREFSIWIPKIRASGNIIAQVDPWNKNEYIPALKKGIAHAKGFALPGESGPIYLFAHSSSSPWELTRYNSIFLRLGELEKGDSIVVWKQSKEYHYAVVDKKEVSPRQVNEVTQRKDDVLILQTCTPIGTDWKRLLIFAKESGNDVPLETVDNSKNDKR
ncbi:MAG: sortase [Candidatus Levybacteria bacterium]|nr:sortase [Candidatus Levybacteria bacterium]